MPKGKKKTVKTVNESQDFTLTTRARFKFKKLELKDSYDWHFVVEVKQILPRTFHWLFLRFYLNEEPYEKRIEQLENELAEVEKNPTLLPSEDIKAVKTLKKAMTKVNKELTTTRNECPTFDMIVDVQQLKYKDGDTIITVRIADADIAMTVGKQAHRLREYLLDIEHRDVDVDGART